MQHRFSQDPKRFVDRPSGTLRSATWFRPIVPKPSSRLARVADDRPKETGCVCVGVRVDHLRSTKPTGMAASDCGQSLSQESTYLPVSVTRCRSTLDDHSTVLIRSTYCPSPRLAALVPSPPAARSRVIRTQLININPRLFQSIPSATNNLCHSHSRRPLCLITPKSFTI